MNTTEHDPNDDIWYRNRMVWLVIAIPATCVLGCLVTIWIALANPDFLVAEYTESTMESAER